MRIDIKLVQYGIHVLNMYLEHYMKKQEKNRIKKWNDLFEKDFKFKTKINDNLYIYHFKDSVLSKLIYDGFEESEISFLRRYLTDADVFIDIGSNIGLFSLHAAQIIGQNGKVYAFEPTPTTFSRLLLNVKLNNFDDIIKCNNLGLSDKKEILKMNISLNGYDAWNTFAKLTNEHFSTQIDVQVETLDNYIKHNNIETNKISLIKVDVEGWEVLVFKGAADLLKDKNAPALLVEFTETNLFAAGTNCYELFDHIQTYGYSWYTYDSINNKLVPEHKRIHYPYNNLIAIKNIEKANERLLNK
jgi:FkbM family methyltransferase